MPAGTINVGGQAVRGYAHPQQAATHATLATQRWPSLKLEVAIEVDDTGGWREMMKVGGSLPVTIGAAVHEVPVEVLVPAEYPARPPVPRVMANAGAPRRVVRQPAPEVLARSHLRPCHACSQGWRSWSDILRWSPTRASATYCTAASGRLAETWSA